MKNYKFLISTLILRLCLFGCQKSLNDSQGSLKKKSKSIIFNSEGGGY